MWNLDQIKSLIFITIKELEKDLQPNILKYHQLDIADQNSISVFSQFIQSEHQGRDSIKKLLPSESREMKFQMKN